MFDFIIIIFVFWYIYKKYNTNSISKTTQLLQKKGFGNPVTIRNTTNSSTLTSTFHGDNYLFEIMKNNTAVSTDTVQSLINLAQKNHYHNIILIPRDAIISNPAQELIKKYNIVNCKSGNYIRYKQT